MECEHDLKLLSPPEIDIHTSLFGGGGYAFPPIYQCIKCHKVFKTGWQENSLVEILVNELTEKDKKNMVESSMVKPKLSNLWLWMIALTGLGLTGIVLVMVILT